MTRCCIGVRITRALIFLAAPLAAAQPPPKVLRVGLLDVRARLRRRDAEAFRYGPHEFGSVARRIVALEERTTAA
jgi:hypothetical protein